MNTSQRRHRITPPSVASGTIAIARRAAFGDVICATVIADAVARMGARVQFNTLPAIVDSGILRHHRSISSFGTPEMAAHVKLDDTYDHDKRRGERMAMSYFYEAAQEQLVRHGINLRPECNLRPQLNILPEEVERERALMQPFQRPWVLVIPRSNAWPNRTVPTSVWRAVAGNVNGTMMWTGTDRINDPLIVDMMVRDFRRLAAMAAAADLVVGVDTGPTWAAVGVNAPILGISQARPFRILMNDQIDWWDVDAGLNCIGCSQHKCPYNVDDPPCQHVPPATISDAINARLATVTGHSVSAVIPCLHDRDPRIERCLAAVIDQVDEVVFSFDGAADGSAIPDHPKVRKVFSPGGVQTGFGKTCNRGARASAGRFIVFLNDDLYLDPGAIRHMKRIASEPDVGAVGGLWYYPNGTIQHGGGHRGVGDVGFGHLDWKKKTPTHVAPVEMEFVTAACVMVRREAFYESGAFAEEFGNYSEDADLCMTMRQHGWKVMFQPMATGIHDESQTTSPRKHEMLRAAHAVFREKWIRYFTHNPPGRLGVFT